MNPEKQLELSIKEKLEQTFIRAAWEGGWAEYAVWCGGDGDTGDEDLDEALLALYAANEKVHYLANKLALRYDLDV